MNWQDYIEEKLGVMMGKPVFKGTRITVEHVLRELGGGTSEGELLKAHPRLKVNCFRAISATQHHGRRSPTTWIGRIF